MSRPCMQPMHGRGEKSQQHEPAWFCHAARVIVAFETMWPEAWSYVRI
jgi:hypothetical protein